MKQKHENWNDKYQLGNIDRQWTVLDYYLAKAYLRQPIILQNLSNEPHGEKNLLFAHAKTKVQLISAFVFATFVVQFLYFPNLKFQASSYLLLLYRLVCADLVENSEDRFPYDTP